MTVRTQQYCEAIFGLSEELGQPPIAAQLAIRLQISNASVSYGVRRLLKAGLITVDTQTRQIKLSEAGRQNVLALTRRRLLAEQFLTDLLQLDQEIAFVEASRLEYVITNRLEAALSRYLGQTEPVY